MADIKLQDLYLSKDELKDVMQLVAKKRNIKKIDCIKYLRNNLKIREE